MKIYLVRVRERPDGALYLEYKASATTKDTYVAISHVWGTPETNQLTPIDGVKVAVQLSPMKKDILQILKREDICGTNWFWMDLFCIDQSPDASISISEQLQAIPAIYKSARRVKVLIESPVCELWQEKAAGIIDTQGVAPDDVELFREEELRHARRCPNMLFYDPWFVRLWTRQEGLYASRIDVITLNLVPCQRLQVKQRVAASLASESDMLSRRSVAEFFLHDKLRYHGLSAAEAEEQRFWAYLDLVYSHRVNMTTYGDPIAPNPRYTPVFDAWFSDRITTKPRDYVLAVFPDVPGYRVPQAARKMSFRGLLADAIRQVGVRPSVVTVPKFPRGMVEPCIVDSDDYWFPEEPSCTGEALDGVLEALVEKTDLELRGNHVVNLEVSLEKIDLTRENLSLVRDIWVQGTDVVRQTSGVHRSSPCTGTNMTHDRTNEDLLHRHFLKEFVTVAVSAFLSGIGEEHSEHEKLFSHRLVSQDSLNNIPDSTYSREFKRFMACLVCGVTLSTADIIVDRAEFAMITSEPFGKLLAMVRRDVLEDHSSVVVVAEHTSRMRGFRLALYTQQCVNGLKPDIVGRTVLPIFSQGAN